ncbi:MAG: bifunctional hydroxymethylpyrimidine kinase/phosphomethylpyrimidine kinase [Desulfofustis sp.]|nr:bifunctional hydroxymethylpyrimidine kinase/phosphomethylpyrimidine kinase [Desulfofustis sp.]NNF46672.1 bifunctional hydroxymethylpyrimidine kinase/phosphomethylpyrimidine kinase [Desulfofustis sp.]NNK57779.1 bifunctional hydroxymethylpyrimidine kinase/phosphomethylpyrimidine kinase [Desulfofustis sp.]
MKQYYRVLTIAGSDSGGGAGIQADLKTISACGCFGTSAITAITAQNTLGVTAIHAIPVITLEAQIRAVLDDIGTDAVKLGMLHSVEVIECVARLLAEYKISNIVLDPVMVATSGDKLIQDEAISALQELLFPLTRLITPNIPEAEIISGQKISNKDQLGETAEQLARRFNLSVMAKGGHLEHDSLTDFLYDLEMSRLHRFTQQKVVTKNTHGTGCTLSSALASYLARGLSLADASDRAIDYISSSLKAGARYQLGKGHGPVHHFHKFWY